MNYIRNKYLEILASRIIIGIILAIIMIQTVNGAVNLDLDKTDYGFRILKVGDPFYLTVEKGNSGHVVMLIQKDSDLNIPMYMKILGHEWEYGESYIREKIGVSYNKFVVEIPKNQVFMTIPEPVYYVPEYIGGSWPSDPWFSDNVTVGFSTNKNGPWGKNVTFKVILKVTESSPPQDDECRPCHQTITTIRGTSMSKPVRLTLIGIIMAIGILSITGISFFRKR